jgi:hypothetical protein
MRDPTSSVPLRLLAPYLRSSWLLRHMVVSKIPLTRENYLTLAGIPEEEWGGGA